MTLASHFGELRLAHVASAALSVSLFTARGMARVAGAAWANHRALRIASYAIDTTLLVAAILLAVIVGQYPFVDGWLTAKVLLLVLYVALGIVALKRARSTRGRLLALAAALATFAAIVAIAVRHAAGS